MFVAEDLAEAAHGVVEPAVVDLPAFSTVLAHLVPDRAEGLVLRVRVARVAGSVQGSVADDIADSVGVHSGGGTSRMASAMSWFSVRHSFDGSSAWYHRTQPRTTRQYQPAYSASVIVIGVPLTLDSDPKR